jgi:hypothetical protein
MHLFDKKTPVSTSTKQTTKKAATTATVDPELQRFITPTTGETWLATPKTMSAQGWLKTELLSYYSDISNGTGGTTTAQQQLEQNKPTYRQVGTRAGNTIVFVYGPVDIGQNLYIFEQAPDGKATLIAKPQTTGTYATQYQTEAAYLSNLKDQLTSKVSSVDTSIHYDSLSIPAKISLDNGETLTRPEYVGLASAAYDPATAVSGVKVRQLGASTLYRTEKTYADTKLTNIGYMLITPLGTTFGMEYAPNTLSLEKYAFDNGKAATYQENGKTVTDTIVAIARGCGGTTAAVTRSDALKLSDLKQVGKTDTSRAVYMPKDDTAALLQKAYDEYKQAFYDDSKTPDSYADFLANHGMVIIENASHELLVYSRQQYVLVGGCAKPVVYLYPTKAEQVSVKVGANVTVSDPVYGTDGWQNVWAQPNGTLTYLGKTYSSLFWEGQGYGDYPGITSGTVVKRADAAKTMRAQLAAQGLNTKEISDFMTFWEPKIPNKPYVRLTWLTTAQMNTLAPLTVSPKPQTVIRVFLDMDGFDTPIKLPAQKLTKVERRGFTVVEWGGLTALARH